MASQPTGDRAVPANVDVIIAQEGIELVDSKVTPRRRSGGSEAPAAGTVDEQSRGLHLQPARRPSESTALKRQTSNDTTLLSGGILHRDGSIRTRVRSRAGSHASEAHTVHGSVGSRRPSRNVAGPGPVSSGLGMLDTMGPVDSNPLAGFPLRRIGSRQGMGAGDRALTTAGPSGEDAPSTPNVATHVENRAARRKRERKFKDRALEATVAGLLNWHVILALLCGIIGLVLFIHWPGVTFWENRAYRWMFLFAAMSAVILPLRLWEWAFWWILDSMVLTALPFLREAIDFAHSAQGHLADIAALAMALLLYSLAFQLNFSPQGEWWFTRACVALIVIKVGMILKNVVLKVAIYTLYRKKHSKAVADVIFYEEVSRNLSAPLHPALQDGDLAMWQHMSSRGAGDDDEIRRSLTPTSLLDMEGFWSQASYVRCNTFTIYDDLGDVVMVEAEDTVVEYAGAAFDRLATATLARDDRAAKLEAALQAKFIRQHEGEAHQGGYMPHMGTVGRTAFPAPALLAGVRLISGVIASGAQHAMGHVASPGPGHGQALSQGHMELGGAKAGDGTPHTPLEQPVGGATPGLFVSGASSSPVDQGGTTPVPSLLPPAQPRALGAATGTGSGTASSGTAGTGASPGSEGTGGTGAASRATDNSATASLPIPPAAQPHAADGPDTDRTATGDSTGEGMDDIVRLPQHDDVATPSLGLDVATAAKLKTVTLSREDLAVAFTDPSDLDAALKLMDLDGNGSVTRDEWVSTFTLFLAGWTSTRAALESYAGISDALKMIAEAVSWTALFFITLAIFEVDFNRVLVPLGTVIISLSFALGSSISAMVTSLLFILVQVPYDVGDRVQINSVNSGSTSIVSQINVLTTEFTSTGDNKRTMVRNADLALQAIVNHRRSPNALFKCSFVVDQGITGAQIAELKAGAEAYLRERQVSWLPNCSVSVAPAASPTNSVEINFYCTQHASWQEGGKIWPAYTQLCLALVALIRAKGLRYVAPAQPVEVQYSGAFGGASGLGGGARVPFPGQGGSDGQVRPGKTARDGGAMDGSPAPGHGLLPTISSDSDQEGGGTASGSSAEEAGGTAVYAGGTGLARIGESTPLLGQAGKAGTSSGLRYRGATGPAGMPRRDHDREYDQAVASSVAATYPLPLASTILPGVLGPALPRPSPQLRSRVGDDITGVVDATLSLGPSAGASARPPVLPVQPAAHGLHPMLPTVIESTTPVDAMADAEDDSGEEELVQRLGSARGAASGSGSGLGGAVVGPRARLDSTGSASSASGIGLGPSTVRTQTGGAAAGGRPLSSRMGGPMSAGSGLPAAVAGAAVAVGPGPGQGPSGPGSPGGYMGKAPRKRVEAVTAGQKPPAPDDSDM